MGTSSDMQLPDHPENHVCFATERRQGRTRSRFKRFYCVTDEMLTGAENVAEMASEPHRIVDNGGQ